jgi:hypothetical protein
MSKRILALMLGTLFLGLSALVVAGSPPGLAGDMPAYYDGKLFTINFTELPSGGETSVHANNTQINIIYQSDQAVAMGVNFISVLNAITGEGPGFNPLWEEFQITFVTIAPMQFFSDDEILGAAMSGAITLTDTDEIYTCAVLGPK